MAERRAPSAWTTVDRLGAWYIVLNVVFWWGPLLLLAPGIAAFQLAVVVGLARDAVAGAVLAVVWQRRRARPQGRVT
jgi:hypothetical protein